MNKLSFKFTGTLKKVVIELGKSGVAAGDQEKLDKAEKAVVSVRD